MYKILEYWRVVKTDGTLSDWYMRRRHLYEKEETFEKFWVFHTRPRWQKNNLCKYEAVKDDVVIRTHVLTKE